MPKQKYDKKRFGKRKSPYFIEFRNRKEAQNDPGIPWSIWWYYETEALMDHAYDVLTLNGKRRVIEGTLEFRKVIED